MSEAAWQAQSKSLIEVQKKGGNLEQEVKALLQWSSGKMEYDRKHNYFIQVDNAFPSLEKPEILASVTYTEPDTKGHSNENKLQLKVGELALTKYAYPECRAVLVLGGNKESWLPYVLEAFDFFFDEVVSIWDKSGLKRLYEIKDNPSCVTQKHVSFWSSLRNEWNNIDYKGAGFSIPCGLLRYQILDKIKKQNPPVDHPNLINSRIAALCLQRSKSKGGTEWDNFRARKWTALEQSRSYFNPLESLVEIILTDGNFDYQGGIAHDIAVPSLLHQLGMENTMLSEDFVLFSKKLKKKVYIQCKASGGGREQHGKNIQNRTKEQITRGILYRCAIDHKAIVLGKKDFIWISILDGDWGVTKTSPLKYIHMLQHAGYDHFLGASTLVDKSLEPLPTGSNPLAKLLDSLECYK